jgi:hypothetical protein
MVENFPRVTNGFRHCGAKPTVKTIDRKPGSASTRLTAGFELRNQPYMLSVR